MNARLIREHRELALLFRAYLTAPKPPSPAMAELAIARALAWGDTDAELARLFSTFRPEFLDRMTPDHHTEVPNYPRTGTGD